MVSPLRRKWTLRFPGPGLSCFPRRICHRHGDTVTPCLTCQWAVTWPCGDSRYCDSRPPAAYARVPASTAGSATSNHTGTHNTCLSVFALVNYNAHLCIFFFNLYSLLVSNKLITVYAYFYFFLYTILLE